MVEYWDLRKKLGVTPVPSHLVEGWSHDHSISCRDGFALGFCNVRGVRCHKGSDHGRDGIQNMVGGLAVGPKVKIALLIFWCSLGKRKRFRVEEADKFSVVRPED